MKNRLTGYEFKPKELVEYNEWTLQQIASEINTHISRIFQVVGFEITILVLILSLNKNEWSSSQKLLLVAYMSFFFYQSLNVYMVLKTRENIYMLPTLKDLQKFKSDDELRTKLPHLATYKGTLTVLLMSLTDLHKKDAIRLIVKANKIYEAFYMEILLSFFSFFKHLG